MPNLKPVKQSDHLNEQKQMNEQPNGWTKLMMDELTQVGRIGA